MSTTDKVKAAADYAGLSVRQIALKMGTSPQNLNQRILRGTLHESDLQRIAQAMGAEYISVFRFPDGKEI